MSENTKNRYDALDNNPRKKKLIFGGLIAVLIVVFLGGIGIGINEVLLTEGTMQPPRTVPAYSLNEPADAAQAVAQLGSLFETVKNADRDNFAKLSVSTSLSVDGESISDDKNDAVFDDILKFIKDDVLERAQAETYSFSCGFDGDFSQALLKPDFTADDIEGFTLEAITDGDGNPIAGKEDSRILSFSFGDEPMSDDAGGLIYRNFNLAGVQASFEKMKELCSEIFIIESSEIYCRGFEIRAEFDMVSGNLSTVEYRRGYDISLNVSFVGELEALGTQLLSFKLSANESYTFIYAGLKLSDDVLWLKKGEINNLNSYRTADDDVTVKWESSDNEIATVDDEGYIKGHKTSETPAIITASFEYLGRTYEDSCEVYVRKPLDEIKVSEKEISLNTGETHALTLSFSPENATVKQALWFSEDEGVAEVDENGVITANAAGTVNIYAIAKDGNFKSTCTVTIKDGNENG